MGASNDLKVPEIAAMLNARANSLAPVLLPNGRRNGKFWETSSIDDLDTGKYSLKLDLSGATEGQWVDFGTAKGMAGHHGDLLDLAAIRMFGGDKGKAVSWAKSELGLDGLDPKRIATVRRETAERAARHDAAAERDAATKQRRAAALWAGAVPIAGTPAQTYLEGRGIDFARLGRVPGSLRYLPDCWNRETGGKMPAMIACIMGLDGALRAVHRTYLDLSAGKGGAVSKARLADAKLSMGPYAGGCIPLWKGTCGKTLRDVDAGTPIYVSEGIEDGLSIAMARPEARIVAGVALANMGGLELPAQAGPIVFIGQNDPADSKAAEAFERAVARQQDAGRKVQTIWPKPEFKDFNDQLCGKRMKAAA